MQNHFTLIKDLPQLKRHSDLFDTRFVHTNNLSVAFNQMKPGASVPPHEHTQETIDIVLMGELEMTIDGETFVAPAGAVIKVGPNVRHAAKAITDCRVVNIFYPMREDFMEQD